jgi:predicted TIM-barrel fold metal-dependent hydrolase
MDTMNQAVSFADKWTSIPIFDIDTHWTEPADLWTSRAPAKYKDRVMHVRRTAAGNQSWHLGDERITSVGPGVVKADLTKQFEAFSLPNYETMARGGTYPADRVAIMDGLGVGTQVMYPNAIGFGASTMLRLGSENELRMFHVQAYNDAIAEMQRESGNRILGQMVLPLWDISASIKEMQRGRSMGLTGISMSDKPEQWGMPSLIDPVWEPFWGACDELRTPVQFHIASGSLKEALAADAFWGDKRFFLDDEFITMNGPTCAFQATSLFISNMNTILNLLLTGLLDKYPKIKFVSVESGLSWVPFIIQALELNFREIMSPSTRAKFKRTPKEAFLEQIYVSYWFEDRHSVDFYLASMGSDNVMFETDFPHPVSLFPGVQAAVKQQVGHLNEVLQRKLLYKNAEKLYGVPVGKVND